MSKAQDCSVLCFRSSGCISCGSLPRPKLVGEVFLTRTHSCPNDLLALPQEMDNILGDSAARLLPIVTETMREVKEKVGLA